MSTSKTSHEAIERAEHACNLETLTPTVYQAPDDGPAISAGLRVEPTTFAQYPCIVGRPTGCTTKPGILVVLDGQRLIKRIGTFVEKGQVDPANLPILIGVDPQNWLSDYTPWWQPAYRKEAPDFGGTAEDFIANTLIPVALDAMATLGCDGPIRVMGYSLSTLAMVQALTITSAFDELLIASPSTWYPGFVNMIERTPLVCKPSTRILLASGANEGIGEPEPIHGIRQDTDRLVATLSQRLATPVETAFDEKDHHAGFALRLRWLLEHAS